MRYLCFKWSKFLNNYHEFKFEAKMNKGQKGFPTFLSFSMFLRDFPVYSTLLLVKKNHSQHGGAFDIFEEKERETPYISLSYVRRHAALVQEKKKQHKMFNGGQCIADWATASQFH